MKRLMPSTSSNCDTSKVLKKARTLKEANRDFCVDREHVFFCIQHDDKVFQNLSLYDETKTDGAESRTEKAYEKARENKQGKGNDKAREKGAKAEQKAEEIIWKGKKLLFFDLETTGLERVCDIVQISAIHGCRAFDQYVFPTKKINPRASQANGLTVKDGELYYKGKLVTSIGAKDAMESFVGFLKETGEQVVLVAHNGFRFDVPRLLRVMDSVGVQLPSNIEGFLDSWLLAKMCYPTRKSCSQPNLVFDVLGVTYDAHNAAADVEALQSLVDAMMRDAGDLEQAVWEKCFKPRSAFESKQ